MEELEKINKAIQTLLDKDTVISFDANICETEFQVKFDLNAYQKDEMLKSYVREKMRLEGTSNANSKT
jgi:hypothetical protein